MPGVMPTWTETVEVALWRLSLPLVVAPLPVTVSVKLSVPSAAGAVKTGRAVFVPFPASYVTVVLAGTCVQACSTLLPQGSSYPAAAPSPPRVTPVASWGTSSIPPSGPAFAIGTKSALPELSARFSCVSFVSFSKIRGGSDPTQVTLERAAALIADKAAAPKRRRSSGSARKRAGGAKGGKKAAGPAKRSTAKRSTAKRSTAKRSTVKPPGD